MSCAFCGGVTGKSRPALPRMAPIFASVIRAGRRCGWWSCKGISSSPPAANCVEATGTSREFVEVILGSRKDAYAGVCEACAEEKGVERSANEAMRTETT